MGTDEVTGQSFYGNDKDFIVPLLTYLLKMKNSPPPWKL
jgi:hypothetical protein